MTKFMRKVPPETLPIDRDCSGCMVPRECDPLTIGELAHKSQMDAYAEAPTSPVQGAQMVPIDLLYPNPANPRKRFDPEEMDKLTASVRQLGVLSPILVVADGERYRIVAGERRYRSKRVCFRG